MTDIMSEAFGRELVARTDFAKESIWLPILAVHQQNAGEAIIRGKTFTDCVIEGPSLMAIVDGVTFEGCNLGRTADPKSLFYKGQGPVLVGVVPFADTRFIRCTFIQIGFTGAPDLIDDMAAGLSSAAAQQQAPN